MASAARVSQIVAQILRTPAPPSFARVSQIVAQTLRLPEARYNAGNSRTGAAITSRFLGVRNLTIKPLPYNYAAANGVDLPQSMFYPTFRDVNYAANGSQIVGGKTTVLTPTQMFQFVNNGSTTGSSTNNVAQPVVFAGWLVGALSDATTGNLWVQKNLTESAIFPTIKPVVPDATIEGSWQGFHSNMKVIAVRPGSRLYSNIMAKYLGAALNGASGTIMQDIGGLVQTAGKLLNPISIISDILLQALLSIIFGAPVSSILVVGAITDYTNGNSNGTIALQCAGVLTMYPGLQASLPQLAYFGVPFQALGGDPDLYVGKANNIITTPLDNPANYNSWQFWNSSGSFGPRNASIYDFNIDSISTVALDDPTLNTVFQNQSALGINPVATPQGWIFILPSAFGLNPASVALRIAPDFSTWEILNFIPSDAAGNAMITQNQPLIVNADRNGFYVGTNGKNFQYTGAADNTVAQPSGATQAPYPVSCMDLTCGNANATGKWAPINPSFN